LEAAEEIVRQLRLRDIGGIIVIDFIDMVLPSNRELLLRRLVECLGRDRTRHQVAEITSLGLVQMTRKRIGTGLLEAFSTECPHCHGRGYLVHDMPVESQKHADGGARSRGRRPNAHDDSAKVLEGGISTEAADTSSPDVAPEEPSAPRGRRGGRRRGGASKEQDAAEPQDEPAGVS
jgi:ribonuclease E